ncbi:hypothetical protein DL769_007465 [Monosporascus sp. CRB-8-3]|nr:hypothetical protein DL769_007465 [Monosporascus sp. CRB-8-3]
MASKTDSSSVGGSWSVQRGRPRKKRQPSRSPSPKPKTMPRRPTRQMVQQSMEAEQRKDNSRGYTASRGSRSQSAIRISDHGDDDKDKSQYDIQLLGASIRPQRPMKRKNEASALASQERSPRQKEVLEVLPRYANRSEINALSFGADLVAAAGPDPEHAATWSERDARNLDLVLQSDVWFNLWRTSIHHFRRNPDDLFTWGLRRSDRSIMALRCLVQLMPHPVWDGDLNLMRYVLQRAVFLRIENHMIPMGPLSPELIDLLFAHEDIDEREQGIIVNQAVRYWSGAGPVGSRRMSALVLVNEMERRMQGRREPEQLVPENGDRLRSWMKLSLLNRRRARLRTEPDFPPDDMKIHKQVPYWLADGCDERFLDAMFDWGRGPIYP